jgi:hypothetical protein
MVGEGADLALEDGPYNNASNIGCNYDWSNVNWTEAATTPLQPQALSGIPPILVLPFKRSL